MSELRRTGENILRPLISQKFPKHAIFFSHGPQAKDGHKQYILSTEAFLIHIGTDNSNIRAGAPIDTTINIAVVRNGYLVHGLLCAPTSNQTVMTRNGTSVEYKNGKFSSEPLHVRAFYRENGVTTEAKAERGEYFFKNIKAVARINLPQTAPGQILDVATGCADYTENLEARLIEIAATHAILQNSGGEVRTEANIDYRQPYTKIKFDAMDTSRIQRLAKTEPTNTPQPA